MTAAAPTGSSTIIGWAAGRVVTEEMVMSYCRSHDPPAALAHDTRAVRRWGARALMVDMVLIAEASERGLAPPALLAEEVATELVGPALPTAGEVAAYVTVNAHLFERPERRLVSHVLVGDEAMAREVARRAGTGEGLGKLALLFSADPGSKHSEGDLGWVARGELCGELEDVCFGAARGEVAGPVQSPFGWHVLMVREVSAGGMPAPELVYATVSGQLADARRREAYAAWLAGRVRDRVSVAPGQEHPALPWSLDRWHRH